MPWRSVVVTLAAAIALSGCAANFGAETGRVYDPAAGVNHRSGDIYLLDGSVIADSEGHGVLTATLTNQSDTDDALAGVEVKSQTGEIPKVTISGGSIDVPAGAAVPLLDRNAVLLETPALKPGYFVTLRFTFQKAAAFSLDVPIYPNKGDFASVTVPTAS
jgi:hypothetical protein